MSLPIDPALAVALGAAIQHRTGQRFLIREVRETAGSQFARAMVLSDGRTRWFAKLGPAAAARQFGAELDGLAALREAGVRAPEPICHGIASDHAFLVMEYLGLRSRESGSGDALGAMLATLHEAVGDQFGWHINNFLGATPQHNTPARSWPEFFREMRLRPQLELAARNGHGQRLQDLGEGVIDALPRLLEGHAPVPSLLHGDLWHGNCAFLAHDRPVLYDPAVYYGDRETDLAMTELFGGFPRSFYAAYFERLPVDEGYARRRELYNLYHVLNHANLFGGGYRFDAELRMVRLLNGLD
jgi:fructosamine-3-kinase